MTDKSVVTTQAQQQSIAQIDEHTKALLEQAAQTQAEAEVSSIPFLSFKGKKFTIGEEKLGNSLDVVILADVFDHAYYDKAYDPDVISPPACFAIGKDVSEMVPDASSPTIMASSCSVCPMNEFGSSNNGKGKACRNGRRLLLAAMVDGRPDMDNLVIANIAPTSLKAYASYSKRMATLMKLPSWAIVTNLSFDDDSAWPQIVPTYVRVLDGEYINGIAPRLAEFAESVSVPYDCSGYVANDAPASEATKKSKMS
jgi:hypothetical protein